jgi:hypothetical protein
MAEDTNSLFGAAAAGGLVRTEEPLVAKRTVAIMSSAASSGTDTNVAPATSGSALITETAETKPAPQPLTRAIKYLRFRYYDGSGWKDSWSGTSLPVGVEVTLGFATPESEMEYGDFEFGSFYLGSTNIATGAAGNSTAVRPTATPAAGNLAEEQIPDIFRRIIYLPGSGANEGLATTVRSSSESAEPLPEEVMP